MYKKRLRKKQDNKREKDKNSGKNHCFKENYLSLSDRG